MVILAKNDDPALTTTYHVRGDFKLRIWLRFGPGAYTVQVCSFTVTSGGFDLDGDGDFSGGYSYSPGITYNVTNTRNEDGRFIYPSYVVQSDDPMITGLTATLTSGQPNDEAKIRAIHDYLVKNTVYDKISTVSGQRKKQDALTVLGTRYYLDAQYNPGGHFLAVCEGYSNTFAALARAAGFQVKYVSSQSMGHGWNHVQVNGVWKFIDVTWDDPTKPESSATNVVDWGPEFVRYDYFLLDNLNGIQEDGEYDHLGWQEVIGRAVTGGSTIPRQKGVPDGWY